MRSGLQGSLQLLALGTWLALSADALMPELTQVFKLEDGESQHTTQSQGSALTQATMQARAAPVVRENSELQSEQGNSPVDDVLNLQEISEVTDPDEVTECGSLAKRIQSSMKEKLLVEKVISDSGKTGGTKLSCNDMNHEFKLSPSHQCCASGIQSGCPFVAVRGEGQVQSIRCHQIRPRGPSTKCYYANATFADGKFTGKETIQNQADTNFVQCKTYEYAQNVQTIERLSHVGFVGGVSHGQGEEVWKPWDMDDDDDAISLPNPHPEGVEIGESVDVDSPQKNKEFDP